MPPCEEHTMAVASSQVSLRTLYVSVDDFSATLPDHPCGIAVSALLRELLLRAARFSIEYKKDSFEARLLALALDEMKASAEHGINLPLGKDRRLVKICEALINDPGDTRPLSEWATIVGATARTLTRLFRIETGLPFVAWRQQVRIGDAIPRLLAGDSVSKIAASQGYGSQSAFTVMFKRVTGKTPRDYMPH